MSDKKIPFAEDSWLYDRETPADSSDKTAGKEPVEEKKSGTETAGPEPGADSGKKADSREISEDEILSADWEKTGKPAPDLDYSDVEIRVAPVEYATSVSGREEQKEKENTGSPESGETGEKAEDLPENSTEKVAEQEGEKSGQKPKTERKAFSGIRFFRKKKKAGDEAYGEEEDEDEDADEEDLYEDEEEQEGIPLLIRLRQLGKRIPVSLKTKSYLLVIGVVLLTAVLATAVNHFWKYSGYEVISTHAQEDTASFSYCNVDGTILRYGAEGATLYDRQNQELWGISYSMDSPLAVVNGDVFAIFDQAGTTIEVCSKAGQIGTISTSYPVVKAAVNRQGMVATIQESGSVTWIEYYSGDGTRIAEMRTALDDPGYPMDLCLSGDGTLLGVTYISYQNGTQTGSVDFYNFGSSGQNQMDNRVAEFTFSGRVLPEIDYMSDTVCVAFRDNGFTVYSGGMIPGQKADVAVDGDIVSVFHDDTYIGLVLSGESNNSFLLRLYNTSGREVMQQKLDFTYNSVDLVDGRISFYGTRSLHVYTTSGVCKFSGDYAEAVKELFAIGTYRYVAVTDKDMELIRLK